MLRLPKALLPVLLLAMFAAPRGASAEVGSQVWAAIFAQADLSEQVPRLQLWLDLQPRHGASGLTTLVRPGVGLRLVDGLILHAGYAWVMRLPEDTSAVHEHRVWEQLLFTHRLGDSWDLLLRARFEQRFSALGQDVGHRFRFMARMTWWFEKDGPLGLVGWDEFFLGLGSTSWGALSGFDQNRLFAGFALRGPLRTRFELGYLALNMRRSGADARTDHIASFNLFLIL